MSEETKIETKKLNKKLIISAAAVIAVALIVVLAIIVPKSVDAKNLEKQLKLGAKYLSELEYEQAEAAYLAAIAIDPKNVDAYLGLAEVYMAQGEYEKAEDVLENALFRVDENVAEIVREKLEEIKNQKDLATLIPEVTEIPVEISVTPVPVVVDEQSEATMEIDSKELNEYLDMAEEYIAQGEYEKAEEVLEDALAQVAESDAEVVKEKLEEIKKYKETLISQVPEVPETPISTEVGVQPEAVLGFKVLTASKSDLYYEAAKNGIILTSKKKNGDEEEVLYGAIDYEGNEVIPYKYDEFLYIGDDGYLALKNTEEDKGYIFDNTGKLIHTIDSPVQVSISEGIATYTYGTSTYTYVAYDLMERRTLFNEVLSFSLAYPVQDGKFFGLDFWDAGLSCYSIENGTIEREDYKYPVSYATGKLKEEAYVYFVRSGISNGYGAVYYYPCLGGGALDYNRIGLMSENGSELYLLDVKEFCRAVDAPENANVKYVLTDVEDGYLLNIGKKFVVKVTDGESSKAYLLDFAKAEYKTVSTDVLDYNGDKAFSYEEQLVSNIKDIILAEYDTIYVHDSGYFFAADDMQARFLNDNGEVIATFPKGASFSNGCAAIIAEDNLCYVVDSEFRRLTDGMQAEKVTAAGDGFIIENGEENSILIMLEKETKVNPKNFITWEKAGLQDEVVNWQDDALEAKMRVITGISDRKIMLSDVWEITELDLSNEWGEEPVKTINALEKMGNLKVLDLSGTQVADLSILENLSYLEELDLSGVRTVDISTFGKLENLKELRMGSCCMTNFDFVHNLPELTTLDLSGLDDLYIISNSNYLEEIGEIDYSPLLYAKKLKHLDLSFGESVGNNLMEILSKLTQLEELNIAACDIEDISMLRDLTNLKYLDVRGNSIADLSVLDNFRNLETLILGLGVSHYYSGGTYYGGSTLQSVEILQNLSKLKTLGLDDCCVKDISGLKKLSNLEELHLEFSTIEDFSVLMELPNLRNLYFTELTPELIECLVEKRGVKNVVVGRENNWNGFIKMDGVIYDARFTKLMGIMELSSRKQFSVPEGVTYVHMEVFNGCSSLTEITFPSTLTEISYYESMFAGCENLTSIQVHEENTYFTAEGGLLMNKEKSEVIAIAPGIEHIVIPESVMYARGLSECDKAVSLTINSPEASSLNWWGVSECESLQEIIVSEENSNFCAENGMLFNADKTKLFTVAPGVKRVIIPDTVVEIDLEAFKNCINLEYLYVSKNIDGYELNHMPLGDCENLILVVPSGSYAETYAIENNIPFETY